MYPQPVTPDPEAERVLFLAALACGAPPSFLSTAWESLGAARDETLAGLAVRFGLASALGGFVSRHAGGHPRARELVAGSLAELQASRASLALLKELAAHPATRGSEAVVVKGAALNLLGLVGDERSFADADVLVDPQHLGGWEAAAGDVGASWHPRHGYEAAAITRGVGLVEVHTALPGFFGPEKGPGSAEVAPFRVPTPCPGLHALTGQVAREVCVQHFVFHHDGAPAHALRTLLDLSALEGTGEGVGLPWQARTGEVQRATGHLRLLARTFRTDARTDAQRQFARVLAQVAAREPMRFAREVDRWMSGEASLGRSRIGLLVRRMFPPPAEMRARVDEPKVTTLVRYIARPPALLFRYLQDRRASAPDVGSVEDWRRLLRG